MIISKYENINPRRNEAWNGKGQRHLKGFRRFTPPRTKTTSNPSPLFHCLFLSHRERDGYTADSRGRKPTLLVATASRWIPFAGQKGWRCGYESENNLIRKRAVPFPFALGPPIVPVNVARSVTSRRVKRPAGRGGGYWWRVETARETRIAYCAKHRTKGTTINNSCYSGGEARTPHISKITCAEEVARRERRGVYSEYSRDTAVSSVLMRTPFPSFHVSNWLERIRLGCMRVK